MSKEIRKMARLEFLDRCVDRWSGGGDMSIISFPYDLIKAWVGDTTFGFDILEKNLHRLKQNYP